MQYPGRSSASASRASIRFAIGSSTLGLVLVALTSRGICAIALGDDREALRDDLVRRFPEACFVEDEADLSALLDQVCALVEEPRLRAELPLDIHGTTFQQSVWAALSEIPPGRTMTYAEIARALGRPAAARAVAQACAANALAVAIPCHRVVRSDGTLSGYRWGRARKRMLLEREARA